MQDLIITITTVEWGLLGIAVLALLIAVMAWRRAGRALKLMESSPVTESYHEEEPAQEHELRPAILLDITVDKNEFDQVTLSISNTGLLSARKVNLYIDKPINIFDTEGLSGGLEAANVTASSAILPRLAILDADNKFPINEIISGKVFDLPAALTMSHGKICDFPALLSWKDENGVAQQKKLTLTV